MITYKNISFQYSKNNDVINNLNLHVKERDIHGILGHNGAGKTTLFRLTLGLLKPQKGKILLGTNDISYMPTDNGLYEKLTAFQNIEFRAKIFKVSPDVFNTEANLLLKQLHIFKRSNESVLKWSTGMKKRLALACALIANPKILILDEPTNGIDPESLNIVVNMLKKINQNGVTILLSSQDLNFISKACNYISIIQNGNLVYENSINVNTNIESIYLKYTNSNVEE